MAGLLLAFLLTGCGCDDCGSSAYSPGIVQGTVTDSVTLLPLAGVTISNNVDPYVLSDGNGNYSIFRPSSRLTALKRGYQSHSTDALEFPANTTSTYNFSLIPGDSWDTVAPQTPTPYAISKTASNSVLDWNQGAGEVEDLAGYVIYQGTDEISLTSYNNIVLEPVDDITNCYTVAAFDASGNESPTSSRICAVLTGCAMPVDERIEPDLRVISSSEIRVHWGVPATRPLQEHRIYRNGVLLVALGPGENRESASSTDEFNYYTYLDTGLSPATEYCYSVATGNDTTPGCDQLCISTWE